MTELNFHNPNQSEAFVFDDPDRVFLRHRLPMVSKDAEKAWVHLAFEGEWAGHPNGKFKFDESVFKQMVANFKAEKNPLAVRFGHPNENIGIPVDAAGWIQDLKLERCPEHGNELWARVEFTTDAATRIKDGKIKFCSVEVFFKAKDRKTGKQIGPRLFGLGLTNSPFIDGQHPIQLSLESATENNNYQQNRESDSMTTENKNENSAEEAKLESDEAPEAPEAPEGDAVDAVAEAAGMEREEALSKLSEMKDEVAKLLKGEASESPAQAPENGDSSETQLSEARIATLSEQVSEKDKEIETLKGQLSEMKKEGVKAKVEDAIKCGHYLEKHRDLLVTLGEKDPEALEKHLSEAAKNPEVPTGSDYKSKAPSNEDSANDISEETIAKYTAVLSAVCDSDEEARKLAIQRIRENQKKLN